MNHSPSTLEHRPLVESLEDRRMMSVTTDAAGWTVVGKSADTRVIYVSSTSGSDTNSGLAENAAVATIARAKSLLRSGMPDHMLLRRGDVWTESLGSWSKSGRSSSEPMLIGTYGTAAARPTLRTGTMNGFELGGAVANYLVLKGIAFYAHTRDPQFTSAYANTANVGLRFIGSTAGATIEDCSFDSYGTNVTFVNWNGTLNNVVFRRNVVTDAWSPEKSQGLFAEGVNRLTLEGNVFDHNGWNESAVGGEADIFSHNIYLSSGNHSVIVRDNVISNAASHGLQARSGGLITGNLFLSNPIHMSFGHVNGSPATPGGVSGEISGNVFLGSRDINGAKRGWAIEIGNTRPGGGTVIRNNIIANDNQSAFAAIRFDIGSGVTNASETVGVNDVTIENNIVYKWYRAVSTNPGFVNGGTGQYAYNDVVIRNNDFQMSLDTKAVLHDHAFSGAAEQWSGNRYYDDSATTGWFTLQGVTTSLEAWRSKVESTAVHQHVTYADPTRSIGLYMASIGGTASQSAFTSGARQLSTTWWNDAYCAADAIAYIRAGFKDISLVPAPGPVPLDTTAPTASFSAAGVTTAGGTSHTFAVTYSDNVGVKASTIDGNDVKVTLPNGTTVAATLVSVNSTADGTPRTATYRFNAPGGAWDSADNGTYSVSLNGGQIADTSGNVTAGKTLGTFTVSVPAPAPTPAPTPTPTDTTRPQVLSATFDNSTSRLTIRFSEPVSASFDVGDIVVRNRSTGATINPSAMAIAYNATTNTAVVTFPRLAGGVLARGRYTMTLIANGITDVAGNKLAIDFLFNFRKR